MVSIPQINITPPRGAVQESTTDVYNAFRMQIEGESNKKSPIESFTEGAGAVQKVIQNQQVIQSNAQKIEANELEMERQQVAAKLKAEQDAASLAFTKRVNTGDLNEQTNALLSAPKYVLDANKDLTLAIGDRIIEKGSPEQAQLIEENVMAYLDRDRIQAKKDAEVKRSQAMEDFKTRESERRESARQKAEDSRDTPQDIQIKKDAQDLVRSRQELDRRQLVIDEQNLGTVATPGSPAVQTKKTIDLISKELSPIVERDLGTVAKNTYDESLKRIKIASAQTNGGPFTLNNRRYASEEDAIQAVHRDFIRNLKPENRALFNQEQAIQRTAEQNATTLVTPEQLRAQADPQIEVRAKQLFDAAKEYIQQNKLEQFRSDEEIMQLAIQQAIAEKAQTTSGP